MSSESNKMDHEAIHAAFGHVVDAGWDAERIAQGTRGVVRKRRRRTARRAIGAGAVVAAVALLIVNADFGATTSSAPVAASGGHEAPNDPSSVDLGPNDLSFEDGSTAVALGEGSALRRVSETAGRIEVALESGAARFSVTPGLDRTFVVDAGDARVVVLGTVFEVYRQDGGVRVRVERGLVRVEWDNQTSEVGAGEEGVFAPEPQTQRRRPRWRRLAARGDYEAALEAIPTVRSAEDLWDAADVARRAGRNAEAIPYLERLVQDYPQGRRFQNASFTLGKVLASLGRHGEAAESFRQARLRGGALAEAILYREMRARSAAGQASEAANLGTLYQDRYPDGRYTDRVEALLQR
ncbi:MAG: FecR domain-containing protein [Myxococcota bacterium]